MNTKGNSDDSLAGIPLTRFAAATGAHAAALYLARRCAGSARSAGYGADQERVGSLRIGNCGFTRNGGGTNRHVYRVATEFFRESGGPPTGKPTGTYPHRKLVRPT